MRVAAPALTNCNILQVQQLLRGLHYMHSERGIMHGDIKPQNLLLVGPPAPCPPLPLLHYDTAVLKIADFGLAKQLRVRALVRECVRVHLHVRVRVHACVCSCAFIDNRGKLIAFPQAHSSESRIAQDASGSMAVLKGTENYMSPSILCHKQRTYSDDVWAACLVIAEIGVWVSV